jgi:HSP20 family protein
MTTKRKSDSKDKDTDSGGVGSGIFGSLSGFINNLGELAEAGERLSKGRASRQDRGTEEGGFAGEKAGGGSRFSLIINGLTDIAEKLNNLNDLSGKEELNFPSKEGGIKGVYGFSLKTGLGGKDDSIKVEPFGNIRKDKKTGAAVVQEIHEPLVDVFEDAEATTLIAEMPGVGPEDIKLDVRDDVLTVYAEKGEKKYRKEILLSHALIREKITVTCNNGIATIRCERGSDERN